MLVRVIRYRSAVGHSGYGRDPPLVPSAGQHSRGEGRPHASVSESLVLCKFLLEFSHERANLLGNLVVIREPVRWTGNIECSEH